MGQRKDVLDNNARWLSPRNGKPISSKEKIAALPPQILRAEQTSNLMRRSVEKALSNISPRRIHKYSQQETVEFKPISK